MIETSMFQSKFQWKIRKKFEQSRSSYNRFNQLKKFGNWALHSSFFYFIFPSQMQLKEIQKKISNNIHILNAIKYWPSDIGFVCFRCLTKVKNEENLKRFQDGVNDLFRKFGWHKLNEKKIKRNEKKLRR